MKFRFAQLVMIGAGVAALAMSACSDDDTAGAPGTSGSGGAGGHAAGSGGKGGASPGGSGNGGTSGHAGALAGGGGEVSAGAGPGPGEGGAGGVGEGGAAGSGDEAGSGGEAGAAPAKICGPGLVKPTAPAAIAVTGSAVLVAAYAASGTQTYTCTATVVDANTTTYAWSAASVPAANLYGDDCVLAGTHYAGPHWKSNDGSIILGTKVRQADSATASSIPQLVLSAVPDAGVAGVFSPVTAVQRLNTVGGIAPAAGCDVAHVNTTAAVPYTATYYFYSGADIIPPT